MLPFQIDNSTYSAVEAGVGVRVVLDSKRAINFYSMHLAYKSYGPYAAFMRQVTRPMIDAGERTPSYCKELECELSH